MPVHKIVPLTGDSQLARIRKIAELISAPAESSMKICSLASHGAQHLIAGGFTLRNPARPFNSWELLLVLIAFAIVMLVIG